MLASIDSIEASQAKGFMGFHGVTWGQPIFIEIHPVI